VQRDQRKRLKQSLGFTLVEVLVAMLILAIGLLGLAGITVVVLRSNTLSQQISQATALASSLLETLRSQSNLTACTSSLAAIPEDCKILREAGIQGKGEAFFPSTANNVCAVSGVLGVGVTNQTFDNVSANGTNRAPFGESSPGVEQTLCGISDQATFNAGPFIRYYKVSAIANSTDLRLVAVVLFRDKFGKWRAVTLDTRQTP
jgi:prepilin-type N-terminal cleavage/methylation domain-containing protein